MIIGLVVGLVLVAVPLYLWRRPEQVGEVEPDAMADGGPAGDGGVPDYIPLVDASVAPRVKLEPFRTIWCKDPGPGKTPPERCDHVTFFEDALSRAIRENTLCAPETKTGATISIVMDFDFRRKKLKIYYGKSSTLPMSRTKELFTCLTRAMPSPDWGSIPHQHAHYLVATKATYPPSETF